MKKRRILKDWVMNLLLVIDGIIAMLLSGEYDSDELMVKMYLISIPILIFNHRLLIKHTRLGIE